MEKILSGQAPTKEICHQQEDPKSAFVVTGVKRLVLTNLARLRLL